MAIYLFVGQSVLQRPQAIKSTRINDPCKKKATIKVIIKRVASVMSMYLYAL